MGKSQVMLLENKVIFILEDMLLPWKLKLPVAAGEAEYFSRFNDFTAGWTIQESWFDSRCGRDISLLYKIQSGSGAHPEYYSIGYGGALQEDKAAGGLKLTIHLHLVSKFRMIWTVIPPSFHRSTLPVLRLIKHHSMKLNGWFMT